MMKKHEGFKNLVYIFMKNNPNKRKSEVADRFMAIGIKRATIYRWIKLVEEKKSIKRKKGSGRPVKISTRANIFRIKKYFNHISLIALKESQLDESIVLKAIYHIY